jgi:hypothetical protein
MNPIVESVVAASGMADDARVWEKQVPLLVTPRMRVLGVYVPTAGLTALQVLTLLGDHYVVHPTGLVTTVPRVNWFWEYPNELRQGTAEQAVRYAAKRSIDPAEVYQVDPDRVHGTYVRYEGQRPDGRDYRLVYARPFPTWCW